MKYLRLLPLGLVLLLSCKEQSPAIDFGPKAADSAFTAAPETPQQRMVVIEEFTGVTCANCPAGHDVVKSIENGNAGRIAAIGIQIFGFGQCNPVHEPTITTRHDNRTQDGTAISNEIYGAVSSMPTAGIDRTQPGGTLLLNRSDWPGVVSARLAVKPDANVTVTSTYNAASHQAVIKVHVAYTTAVTKAQKLNVVLVEDEIVDAQEGVGTGGFVQDYLHQHVLRDVLTAPVGDAILSAMPTKAAGQVYERTFVYDVNYTDWNPDHCKIIAYLSNNEGADKDIVQGAETKLK